MPQVKGENGKWDPIISKKNQTRKEGKKKKRRELRTWAVKPQGDFAVRGKKRDHPLPHRDAARPQKGGGGEECIEVLLYNEGEGKESRKKRASKRGNPIFAKTLINLLVVQKRREKSDNGKKKNRISRGKGSDAKKKT